MAKNKRVYRNYQELEEYHCGMWRVVRGDQRKRNVMAAAALMRKPEAFKAAMLRAVREWPISCEVALTADAVNRIAWLGHAGCCLGAKSPEENTRAGWHTLSALEQSAANRAAQEALEVWEGTYQQPRELDLFSFGGISNVS